MKIRSLPKIDRSRFALTKTYLSIPERTDVAAEATGIVRTPESAVSGFLLDWLAGADAWSVNSRAKGNPVERTI